MAVLLPRTLPAAASLRAEGCPVAEDPALTDGTLPRRRTLTVVLVNLMPDKASTEADFARLLANGPQDVRLLLAVPDGYVTTATPADHMARFYRPFFDLPLARIDAVIVTGAPVETLPFDHVFYWDGLRRILDWLDAARMPSLHVCWGAQAAMHHYHGVEKHPLRRKRFGLYPHMPMGSGHGLLTGIDLPFHMPVSRQSETRLEDLVRRPGLRPVLTAPVAGVGLVRDRTRPAVYCLNHPEYGPRRLPEEFARDRKAGREIDPPAGYDAGLRRPQVAWQTAARTLYRNWITEIAATDPRTSADVALDWLLRAQLSGSTAPAGSPCRLQ
ncbi:homoserine O-acetyltransferase/O-succinyltransferase family protein [Thalassobaculum salexigens]|uniref:homoserine O-acetyltransferase/O-succinyltransferase family protein n=1 Tax=Thalassobaculum salexigens TaxID=455360 RepID=UPI000686F88A|nr:homoserine O-succinyltransferase [Thalassobaculum salexigens]